MRSTETSACIGNQIDEIMAISFSSIQHTRIISQVSTNLLESLEIWQLLLKLSRKPLQLGL